ncbi:hypothetical protein [Streptomyces sp. NBC_01190]|uniref:hypothetical protein n=1 Tax=Streptomyces sp. NBC_01190 TaxID=2903767 RepID=UPI00386B561D|nr:hypothetical protein OG519_29060 [Streptomyces sp. NBC_01190]
MSVLEFIASLKWPVVVLVLLGYGSRTMKKHPNLRKWIAAYVEKRDVRGKMGPAEFEAITPATSAIVRAAVASDVELAAIAGEQTSTPDTSVLRREVVEDLLRSSAQWGYEMAQIGMRTPPNPYIRWGSDGRPEILFGVGTPAMETRMASEAEKRAATEGTLRPGLGEAVRRHYEKIEAEEL